MCIIEGSLEVNFRQYGEMKSRQGRGREKRKSRRERVRRQKIQMREKVGKSRNTVFFSMICGSGGSKSKLAKAAGAEPASQRKENCTPL